MNFSNKKVSTAFSSSDNQNVWGNLEGIGWRKVQKKSDDGATNMFLILVTAKANDRSVSGTIDDNDQITHLYLN